MVIYALRMVLFLHFYIVLDLGSVMVKTQQRQTDLAGVPFSHHFYLHTWRHFLLGARWFRSANKFNCVNAQRRGKLNVACKELLGETGSVMECGHTCRGLMDGGM